MTEAKYSTHTYNLSIKRVDTPVNLSGGSINVLGVKGDCFIKINDKSQDPINLLHTANIKTEFTKFYLSNNVQVGGYVTIVIGKHCEFELTTNIAQATHTSLLLPQQNIPAHLRDRAIGAPEVINVWDIENATLRHSFNIGAQDTSPTGLFFSPDGVHMYTLGQVNDIVNEYYLSTAWDISTAAFCHFFQHLPPDASPRDLFFSPDGTYMYIIDLANDRVVQYSLLSKWVVSSASQINSFDIMPYDTMGSCIVFNPTGSKMYIGGIITDRIMEFDLSTAWDISTAVFKHSFNVSTILENPRAIFFSPDGLKLYVMGAHPDKVIVYRLLEAWNITTAVFYQSFDYNLIIPDPYGLFFSPDGSKMYITCPTSDSILEFDL